MKLLIDGRVLKHKYITGVERYTFNLVEEFKKMGLNYDIFIPQTSNRYLQHIWENVRLPIKAGAYDILFCPGNISPLWKSGRCRYVTTIHDISFKFFKDSYSFPYRFYHDKTLNRVLKLSDAIVTISNYEKEMLSKYYPWASDKIKVICNGISDKLKDQKINYEKQKYILYVGSLNKRKNLEGLIKAFVNISDKVPHDLVIAGAKQGLYKGTGAINHSRIKYLGFVKDDELIELYRNAALFVFPSFYEGFGLPVLEAMVLGCPVITSNTSSIPEVAGDAAIKVDPRNTEEIASAMIRVLNDQNLSWELIAKGLERVKLFSWKKSAEALVSVFRELTEKNR